MSRPYLLPLSYRFADLHAYAEGEAEVVAGAEITVGSAAEQVDFVGAQLVVCRNLPQHIVARIERNLLTEEDVKPQP